MGCRWTYNLKTMFKLFKRFDCGKKILQLELNIEHQQKQIDELRELLLSLSAQINKLETELNYQIDRHGKGL